MLILTTKWRQCENYKESLRFTWCNCWFKEACFLWIWIDSGNFYWRRDPQHGNNPLNVRQSWEFCRCLKMWEAYRTREKNTGKFRRRNSHYSLHMQTFNNARTEPDRNVRNRDFHTWHVSLISKHYNRLVNLFLTNNRKTA